MAKTDDKIIGFQSAVDKEISIEIKTVIESAAQEKEKTVKKLKDDLLRYSFSKISEESKRIKQECGRRVSQKSYDARRDILSTREKLIDDFFIELKNKLLLFTKGKTYKSYLIELIGEAGKEISFQEDTVIYLKKEEDDSEIRKKYPILNIEKTSKIKIGGVAFYYPSEQKYIDLTFDKKLILERNAFSRNRQLQIS